MDEEQFLGVVVESNAGRSFIRAARIVDASGDAAVIARAGFRYRYGDNGNIQNPTMFFRLGNVDLKRYLAFYGNDTICPPKVTKRSKQPTLLVIIFCRAIGFGFFRLPGRAN